MRVNYSTLLGMHFRLGSNINGKVYSELQDCTFSMNSVKTIPTLHPRVE